MAEPHTIAGAIPAARTLNPLQPEDAYVIVTNTLERMHCFSMGEALVLRAALKTLKPAYTATAPTIQKG